MLFSFVFVYCIPCVFGLGSLPNTQRVWICCELACGPTDQCECECETNFAAAQTKKQQANWILHNRTRRKNNNNKQTNRQLIAEKELYVRRTVTIWLFSSERKFHWTRPHFSVNKIVQNLSLWKSRASFSQRTLFVYKDMFEFFSGGAHDHRHRECVYTGVLAARAFFFTFGLECCRWMFWVQWRYFRFLLLHCEAWMILWLQNMTNIIVGCRQEQLKKWLILCCKLSDDLKKMGLLKVYFQKPLIIKIVSHVPVWTVETCSNKI